jgi:hypothetical protein
MIIKLKFLSSIDISSRKNPKNQIQTVVEQTKQFGKTALYCSRHSAPFHTKLALLDTTKFARRPTQKQIAKLWTKNKH